MAQKRYDPQLKDLRWTWTLLANKEDVSCINYGYKSLYFLNSHEERRRIYRIYQEP